MSMQPFECHVVYRPTWKDKILPIARNLGFSVSFLVGDDELGDEKMMYCTRRSEDFPTLNNDMERLVASSPAGSVMRYKIECVLLDVVVPAKHYDELIAKRV